MTQAGVLDRRVRLQSNDGPTNGDASDVTWSTFATVYAEKLSPHGVERFLGAQRAAEASQGYRVRYRTDVDPTDRLLDGDEAWDIVAAYEGAGRRTDTILLVERLNPRDTV